MFTVIVNLTTSTICFLGSCYPALVGTGTPKGNFDLKLYTTEDSRYGGDLLVFKEDKDSVWAIHRVIDVPKQNRLNRLKSTNPKNRNHITGGCINIDPDVYLLLKDCCSNSHLEIK